MQTKGKTYLARASNIAKYTDGRFNPHGQLSNVAQPLTEPMSHPRITIPVFAPVPNDDILLLVTEEDCQIETLLPHAPAGRIGLLATRGRSPLAIGDVVLDFATGAVEDARGAAASDAHWVEKSSQPPRPLGRKLSLPVMRLSAPSLSNLLVFEAAISGCIKSVVTAIVSLGRTPQKASSV